MQAWHDFFIAEVGASAALAGLLFVALSINIARILKDAWLPARAAQSLGAFMLVVVQGSIGLVPGEPAQFAGYAFLATGLIALVMSFRLSQAQLRAPLEFRHHAVINVVNIGVLHVLVLAGAAGCIASLGLGVALIAASMIYALCYGMFNAWVLLVEILR